MSQLATIQTVNELNTSAVDFEKPDEANKFADTICQAASESGMFTAICRPERECKDIRRSAKQWLKEVDERLGTLSPAEALKAIACYDIIHRIGYGTPAYPETISKTVLRAFEAFIHGDKSIDEYELFRYISAGLGRREKVYFGRMLEWHSMCLDRWHRQFRYGTCLDKISEYDRLQRVSILLESNLSAFEAHNEAAFKQRLLNAHKHYLDTAAEEASPLAIALANFQSASRKYLAHYTKFTSYLKQNNYSFI